MKPSPIRSILCLGTELNEVDSWVRIQKRVSLV
jgi:hypothetical protein